MRHCLLLYTLLYSLGLMAQQATMISLPNEGCFDPEILNNEHLMVWMDDNRNLWIASLDSTTGGFNIIDGKELYIDQSAPLTQSWNAGEFLLDANGWKVIYSKNVMGVTQLFSGSLSGTNQLTSGTIPNAGAIVSRNPNYNNGGLLFFNGNIDSASAVWSYISSPTDTNYLGDFEKGWSHGDFLPGNEFALVFNKKDINGYYQLFLADSINQLLQLTSTPFHKQNPMAIKAPEFDNEIILGCIKELPSGDSLLFFKKNMGQWEYFSGLGIPPGSAYQKFSSSEMFTFQNRSFISLQIEDSVGTGLQNAKIWILSLDGQTRLRVDEQNGTKLRTDPEYYVTTDNIFIYYNIRFNSTWELWVSKISGDILASSNESFNDSKKHCIYPNPTNKYLNIRTETNFQNFELSIYNLTGSKVLDIENKNRIDISSFPSGLYFLELQINNSTETHKILKIE